MHDTLSYNCLSWKGWENNKKNIIYAEIKYINQPSLNPSNWSPLRQCM